MYKQYHLRSYPHADEFPFHIGSELLEGGFPAHGHDFIELTVIFEGRGQHTINGVPRECHPGDTYVFHRGTVHAFAHAHKLAMMNVMFAPAFLTHLGRDVRTLPGFQALFVLTARPARTFNCMLNLDPLSLRKIRSLLEHMEQEHRTKSGGYQTSINGYLTQTIVDLSRLYATTRTRTAADAISSHAMAETAALIESTLTQPHTVASMASAAHMSRRHFFRLFVKAFGTPPTQYILHKRLDRAAELLTNQRLRITEAAFESGFSDSNYFTRQFVKRYGMSPRAFRKLKPLLN